VTEPADRNDGVTDAAVSSRPMVRISNVWKKRGPNAVLRGVNLVAQQGQVLCLLGPSGAGKSTLLRCINAIELPDRGLVYVDGVAIGCRPLNGRFVRLSESKICRQRADIGMVFQNFNLFPHMSVLENLIDAPIRIRREKRTVVTERAYGLLERVGLKDKAKSYPRHLSGGQQQRVAIARALAMQPKLMLFDEPTSALDPHLTDEVLDVMKGLAKSGMTMIVVTHEIGFARQVADVAMVMVDGVIVEGGPARKTLTNPEDARARQFLAKSLQDPQSA
jgi:polar amino acid transport system ATP-binding protein